jgi:hypothetical protein
MGHANTTGDLSWNHAAFEQVGCPHSTLFHGLMITLTDNASRGSSSAILLYRNELSHASVSHHTPCLR